MLVVGGEEMLRGRERMDNMLLRGLGSQNRRVLLSDGTARNLPEATDEIPASFRLKAYPSPSLLESKIKKSKK